ncbi:MAG: hypothetical protein ACLVAK_08460 [Clostridia bacterium]|jgi:hypothetical protein
MANYEKTKEAKNKYRREKTKEFKVRFFPADQKLYEMLQKQDYKNKYIKNLIRKDMEEKEKISQNKDE